eukprot:m.41604 g.41604  ORF g.41604 m.41604 type:complete len:447 (-) comp8227_c0_seq1:136-1476(-)
MGWCFICFAAASMFFCCFSSSMKLCCVTTSATATRVAYAIMFTLSSITAWVMLAGSIGERLNSQRQFTGEIAECEIGDSAQQCGARWSQLAVLRIMFAAFLFFGFMGIMMCGVKNSRDVRSSWQNGFWFWKVAMWIGLTVAAFFIHNDWFVKYWGYFGLVGAFIYMIIQGVYVVLFSHAWAARFKSDDPGRSATTVPLGTLLSLLFILIITVVLYIYYTYGESRGGCERNKVIISINFLLFLVMLIAGVKSTVDETRGLLQPAVISAYTTYLTWSAVSQTTDRCLPDDNDPSDWLTLVVGFLLALIVIINASTMYINSAAVEADQVESSTTTDDNGDKVTVIKMYTPRDNEVAMVQYVWWAFHWQIALACCFMQNVLTNWATIRTSDGGTASAEVDSGDSTAPIWIQAVAGYIVVAIYLWDVLGPVCGPMCCPNRTWESNDKSTRL